METDRGGVGTGRRASGTPRAEGAPGLDISVVIPVLNGEHLLGPAHAAITRALIPLGQPFELVFVDDGSTDRTWAGLRSLVGADSRVRAVRLEANVGQAGAIASGIAHTRGTIVVTTDVDLETDPEDIPLLLAALGDGIAVASGRRSSPRAWQRELPSRVFNGYTRCRGIRLRDIGCGTNALRRDTALAYAAVPDIRRELPSAVLAQLTDEVIEVSMRSRRPSGSQISSGQLVMLWTAFERRRGRPRPTASALVVTGAAALAASSRLRRARTALRSAGAALTAVGASWLWLDRRLDRITSTRAPVVTSTVPPSSPASEPVPDAVRS